MVGVPRSGQGGGPRVPGPPGRPHHKEFPMGPASLRRSGALIVLVLLMSALPTATAGATPTACSRADWYAYNGTRAPASGNTVPAPPEGTYAAISDQVGGSDEIMYQDIALPAGGTP